MLPDTTTTAPRFTAREERGVTAREERGVTGLVRIVHPDGRPLGWCKAGEAGKHLKELNDTWAQRQRERVAMLWLVQRWKEAA